MFCFNVCCALGVLRIELYFVIVELIISMHILKEYLLKAYHSPKVKILVYLKL